jgi:hypothetical protein
MKLRSSWLARSAALYLVAFFLSPPLGFALSAPVTDRVADSSIQDPQQQGAESSLPASVSPAAPTPQSAQSPLPSAPLGTAAAPDMRPEGGSASRPAGAAIAAAKQKRAHSLALRVGLLVGAGIAIGTVVALSAGSSSRPQ